MSRYRVQPFDTSRTHTYPLSSRPSKVSVESFGRPHKRGGTVAEFLSGLPQFLGARNLRDLALAIGKARAEGKPVLWGLGAHVIKTGLSPILIDLMDRGFVAGIALNGAGVIHDFEIATAGSTSEDVESQLERGDFGMAEETGLWINSAISEGTAAGLGIGESLGRYLAQVRPPFGDCSLLLQSYLRSIPATVHVTIGADIIHNHPACSPGDTGEASHRDFRLFASLVAGLDGGGVYLNCGSAVTLPEVFLKCVTLVRNSGQPLRDFTTANLDFIQHYRPNENVIKRPVKTGGRGIAITGHHEILVPLLAAWLIEISVESGNSAE
ncbi:MAG: hypothetical protein H6Q06_2706 [Acidobacteria bacterium]|jgi:hypothetical protein|nr:hypothetical protein [Acidobacteriota bacterium]